MSPFDGIASPAWMADALCAQVGGDGFFPEMRAKDADEPVENVFSWMEAKKVCAACDVREVCLDYALDNQEAYGIWGGLTAVERKRLKREKAS